MNWWQQLLVSLATGGVAAALVTTMLSVRRFSRERWWEKRLALYSGIMEALHDVMRFWGTSIEELEGGMPYPPDVKERIRATSIEAGHLLLKYAATSELILKPSVAKILKDYISGLSAMPTPGDLRDHFEACLVKAEETLSAIREAAKKDLALRGLTRF